MKSGAFEKDATSLCDAEECDFEFRLCVCEQDIEFAILKLQLVRRGGKLVS